MIHLSKPIECTVPRMNPNVNRGFLVIVMCQRKVVDCNKCTGLVGGCLYWGRLHVLGQGIYIGNLCAFCAALKIVFFFFLMKTILVYSNKSKHLRCSFFVSGTVLSSLHVLVNPNKNLTISILQIWKQVERCLITC